MAQGLVAKLLPTQNTCLRVVVETYKAILIKILETKTYISLLDFYLDKRLAVFRDRLANSQVGQSIQKVCKVI